MGEAVYPSQTQYVNGSTMCTPACYLFSCGCVDNVFRSMPLVPEEMEQVMIVASQIQTKLMQRCMGQHRMFSVTDVKNYVESPAGIRCTEVMGTVNDLPGDFISQFDDDKDVLCIVTDLKKLVECMPAESSVIVTANHHTVSLLNSNGRFWFFDPMVACIRELGSKEEVLEHITSSCIPRRCDEFTGMLVRREPIR